MFYNNPTRIWNKQTLNDGDLLNAEFERIYINTNDLNTQINTYNNSLINLQNSVDSETTNRTTADVTLQNNIDNGYNSLNNNKANKSGDTFTGNIIIPNGTASDHAVNKSQLDGEASSRVSADSTLQTNITNEIADRVSGDNSLNNAKADRAGDVFTGNIVVPDAQANTHAVNKSQLDNGLFLKVDKSSVVNSDSSNSTVDPVSAYQVKLLKDSIINIVNTLLPLKINVSDIINDLISDIADKPASAHTVFILKDLVDTLNTNKINISDIVNNTTSVDINKPLSANQGKILKDTIGAEETARISTDNTLQTDINTRLKNLSSSPDLVLRSYIVPNGINSIDFTSLINHVAYAGFSAGSSPGIFVIRVTTSTIALSDITGAALNSNGTARLFYWASA